MTYQLIISNANYYLADHFFTGDILVADGRIAGIYLQEQLKTCRLSALSTLPG